MTLQPLDQQPRAEGVADALRRAILDGRIAPGTQIREVHVAAELGVSRAPLREALRTLEEEGLVERRAYRGAFVAQIGADTVEEIASLRVRLEPYAVELALPALATEAGMAALQNRIQGLGVAAMAGDVPAAVAAHMAVHRLFYEQSGHRLLLDSWRSWESQLRLALTIDHSVFTPMDSLVAHHESLVTVIAGGRKRDIATAIRRHVEGAAHAVSRSSYVHADT